MRLLGRHIPGTGKFLESAEVDLSLPNDQLQSLLKYNDLSLVALGKGGDASYAIVPNSMLDSSGQAPDGFIEYWMSEGLDSSAYGKGEDARAARYSTYAFMNANSSEAAMTLDTYADEAVAAGMAGNSPLEIKIDGNAAVAKKVKRTLLANHFITEGSMGVNAHRATIKEMAKMGDVFFKLKRVTKDAPIRIVKVKDPATVKVVEDRESSAVISYVVGRPGREVPDSVRQSDFKFPWELVHFKIPDMEFEPYGRSILESLRAPYQQLLINEALLALSRASRVERLIIKVPTKGGPTAAFSHINTVKNLMKNTIFGGHSAGRGKARTTALTEVLWIPSGKEYEIDRLGSSVDISSTDDVEHFQNKVLMATRLPKSYLLAEEPVWIAEGALAAQDLKFARALLPLQAGYVDGLTELVTTLCILEGGDMSKIKVEVKLAKPQALSKAVIEQTGEGLELVETLVANFTEFAAPLNEEGEPERFDPMVWKKLVQTLTGLPEDILKTIAHQKDTSPGDLNTIVLDSMKENANMMENVSWLSRTNESVFDKWGVKPLNIAKWQKENL